MAVAIKILPGKLQDAKNMANTIKNERWAEYVESQKRQGITLERDFLQAGPEGDFIVSYWEAEDMQKSMTVMMQSKDPFDVWLKQQYQNIAGINMEQMPSEEEQQQGPQLLLSYDSDSARKPLPTLTPSQR